MQPMRAVARQLENLRHDVKVRRHTITADEPRESGGALPAVFTERRGALRRHAGEISFPGGRREPHDADLLATALRETHEEIGLPPERVELLGALQPTPTFVTDYAIYPFVGLIEPGFAWVLAEAEVGRVLELPLESVRRGYARRPLLRPGAPLP